MTRAKKITISLLAPAVLAGLLYCLYLAADKGFLGESIGMIVFIPGIILFLEHLLIGKFLYGLGIGTKVILPAAGLNEEYPLGWFLAVLLDYAVLSALTYSILLLMESLRSQSKKNRF